MLLNGASVDYGHWVQDGNRVAMYPLLTLLEVAPLLLVDVAGKFMVFCDRCQD